MSGNAEPPSRRAAEPPGRLAPALALLAALALARIPESLLLLRLDDLGVAVALVPLVWAGLHVVRTLSAWPGGMLADRFGAARLVAAGGLLFAALAWLMGRAGSGGAAVGVFLALGLATGLTEPAERLLVARLGGWASGRAFGGYHALTGLAALPAALAFGALYQRLGAGAALTASAVATALLAGAVGAGREAASQRRRGPG